MTNKKSRIQHCAWWLALPLTFMGCGGEPTSATGANVDSSETLPIGRYRCYILRAGDGGALTPAQRPGSAGDPTGAGTSGKLGKYQGHLNILPNQGYDWFGNAENQGEYDYDPSTREIQWLGGTFGDGSVSATLGENSAGTPVIRMHYTFDDGTSLDHSCRLSATRSP